MATRTVTYDLGTTGVDAQGNVTRTPLVVAAEPVMDTDHMLINIGPQHPATHGVLRLVVELDGEVVVRVIPHVGYLHSGFEKLGEYRTYNQIIPLTDRNDYLAAMSNNVCLAQAAEKLMGIEITERCTVLRVIACEIARISSHLVWAGTTGIDIGAFTVFLWMFQERERLNNFIEAWTGARLTTTLTRVGGLMADIPDGWAGGLKQWCQRFPKTLDEVEMMLSNNNIWLGRNVNIGVINAEDAINYSLSGPMIRASGVPYDVRKDCPYLGYETYDFEVPVGEHGDCYDRYLVRMDEMRQSTRIILQALDRLPEGDINVSNPRVILPAKSRAMGDMEAMIFHFKQVMEGVAAPIGEAYSAVEGPRGELGYYFVSDGTAKPVRWRIRPPAFINLAALPKMAEGHLLSDLIAINASVDIVMGEVDR
jgi:NADH-quinone oxidoreductase subunit D